MDLTVDAFHALARSSPWRWLSLHFRSREAHRPEGVEAWLMRPGWLRVDAPGSPPRIERCEPRRPMQMWFSEDPDFVPPPPPEPRWAMDVAPTYRPDGLVAERPQDSFVEFDDPLYGGYTWVAMLDPEELSHHVAVSDLRAEARVGRETWRATVRALDGYEARCADCCDLLVGGAGSAFEHDVSLDVQTGVLVSLRAQTGEREWWLDNEIVAVDDDVVLPD